MQNTERLISDVFNILAFITVFLIRVIVGSVRLAIYIYQTIEERASIQESELAEIAEPLVSLAVSPQAAETRVLIVRVTKVVFRAATKTVRFIWTNAPTWYSDIVGFYNWIYSIVLRRKPLLLLPPSELV